MTTLLTGAAPIAQGYGYDADGNLARQWLVGDANCDGLLNGFDVDSFVATVGDPNSVEPPEGYDGDAECWGERFGWADINGDTYINNFDVDPFVDLLVGGQAALARTLAWDAENRLIDVRARVGAGWVDNVGAPSIIENWTSIRR